MSKLSGCALVIGLALAPLETAAGQTTVNPDARVLAEFKGRIDAYMKLHTKLLRESPALKTTEDLAQVRASREALAKGLRAARTGAAQGDIFTPDATKLFRRLLSPQLTGPGGQETKASMKEDAPAKIALKVNASYPEDQPLPTVPPNILASLPKLPEALEYRIVQGHLLLRDAHANLIVDFMPNAVR